MAIMEKNKTYLMPIYAEYTHQQKKYLHTHAVQC